jgi:hypothetical protein
LREKNIISKKKVNTFAASADPGSGSLIPPAIPGMPGRAAPPGIPETPMFGLAPGIPPAAGFGAVEAVADYFMAFSASFLAISSSLSASFLALITTLNSLST